MEQGRGMERKRGIGGVELTEEMNEGVIVLRGIFVGCSMGAPLERIKFLLQTQNYFLQTNRISTPFPGIYSTAKGIIKEEGFRHLWRGNFTNILRETTGTLISYQIGQNIYQFVATYDKSRSKEEDGGVRFIAMGVGGAAGYLISYPLEYTRTLLATDLKTSFAPERNYRGISHIFSHTLQNGGLRRFFTGFWLAGPELFFSRAISITLMESIFKSEKDMGTQLISLSFIPVLAGLASHPFDTLKRRLILSSDTPALTLAKDMMTKEGIKSFYGGFTVTVFRGFLTLSLLSLTYIMQNIVDNG